MIRDLRKIVQDNFDRGKEKTLIFLYYAGHGVMTKMLETVCNPPVAYDPERRIADKQTKHKYPMENSLRSLG